MGLLDDAIREHLDLKRRSGGDPAEIERLEQEALGPVRREFAGSTAVSDDPRARQDEHAAPIGEDLHGHDELPRLEPERRGALGDDFGHDEPVEEPRKRGFLRRAFSASGESEHEEPPRPEPPARREPPRLALEGTEHHDDEPEAPAGGRAAAAPSPTTPPDEQATQVHRVVEPEDHDEPLERPERVERKEPDEPLERPERVERKEPDADDTPPTAPAGSAHEHAAPDEPDVLEETPEFLQDAPEHDRLWFEQRAPRDFDFDG
jgi:hypothetical protein